MSAGKSILRNTAVVAVLTALSRVLGLVREMFQSRLIGAGVEQSAFAVAFAIPNMARRMFGEGALTAAFVPVFKGEVETVGLEKAAHLARAVMTMVMLILGSVVVLAVVGLTQVDKIEATCELVELNGGENGGLVNIESLQRNLDALKDFVEAMQKAIGTGFTSVGASTAANGALGKQAFEAQMAGQKINFEDMEDTKITH